MLKPKSRRQAELDKLKRDAQSRAKAKIRNSKVAKATQGRSPMFPTLGGIKKSTSKRKPQKTAAQMGSKPVQERDTGPGGMTATGSKTRRSKRVLSKPRTTSREKASRPKASENTNTLRVYKALKKKK